MRFAVGLGALGLAACASTAPEGGPRDSGPIPVQAMYSFPGTIKHPAAGQSGSRVYATTSADLGMQTFLSVPLDSAYRALQKGYLALGLELTTKDEASHVVGNNRVVVRQKMLGRNLSAYFICGQDAVMGWPRADHQQVIFSAVSTLSKADDGHTRVVTLVTGEASDLATSASAVYCSSTGLLETTILKAAGYEAD